ncbi:membrane-associated oxidoreductase [Streptomyces sp. NPDC092369]|uniref:membrane-associated oxidoreductase n=1 Tax=Streptomyces sp. NPDC092369 TaxID=3366015 RepID=UPI00382B343F
MEISDLTPAELRVWRAFPRGETVDFRESEDEDVSAGGEWGPERTVRAEVLKALVLSAPQEEGEVPGLSLSGARVTGVLNLIHAVVDHAVRLVHCHFDEPLELHSSRLRALNLRDSVFPALALGNARIDSPLRLTRCRTRGPVKLGGIQTSGAVFLKGAEIRAPEAEVPVLQLNQAAIGHDFMAAGLRVYGETRLNGATVAGKVNLESAEFHNPGGVALSAEALDANADVNARRLRAYGRIELRGARIAGRLDLSRSHLSHPGGTALRASSSVIGELWLYGGDRIEGVLNLRRAHIEVLSFGPEVLPDEVRINNLSFTTLTPHLPAEQRLPMLERDGEGYVPYAYEQLTAAYRRIGDDRAAREVQLAKQLRHRATLPWYGRTWGHLQEVTVGYGFRPLRAAIWLLSLLATGSIAYALHNPPALKPSEAPPFNAVFYTLDLLLPVISFGQENAFAPRGAYQALSYVLIITGWILATTVIAGVTRSVSRQ